MLTDPRETMPGMAVPLALWSQPRGCQRMTWAGQPSYADEHGDFEGNFS
jgi:hypothetical protein